MEKLYRPSKITCSPAKAEYYKRNPFEEMWMNDIYQVNVRKNLPTTNNPDVTVTHLSIKRLDYGVNMDWRHMQEIKNQLVGEENEGVEIFPAESRLVDGANQFHMWVFEDPEIKLPFGFFHRLVSEDESIGNVQRPFETKPDDLKECEALLKREYKKNNMI